MPTEARPAHDPPTAPGQPPRRASVCAGFDVRYRSAPTPGFLAEPGTLAVIGFGRASDGPDDPRHFQVELDPLEPPAPLECWRVAASVTRGTTGGVRWSQGGGWRFLSIQVDEGPGGDIEDAARDVYARLLDHVAASAETHILRIWNYLYAINADAGDAERYRRFCNGRAASMSAHGLTRYPAATAIGHRCHPGRLQVYALCARDDGVPLENPRQVSAWDYPRQYGPTSPQFARAMQLPGGVLAISGTAAIVGHASHYPGDVAAQTEEAFTNVATLVREAGLPPIDGSSLLKIYVRNPEDLPAIRAALGKRVDPSVPRVFFRGDVCRRELLVEIEAWR